MGNDVFFLLCFAAFFLFNAKGCGKPGLPSNSSISIKKDNFTVKERIRYFCNFNLLLYGPETRRCQENHTWSQTVPVCLRPTEVVSVLQSNFHDNKQKATDIIDKNPSTCSSTRYGKIEKNWKVFLAKEAKILAIRLLIPDRWNLKKTFKDKFSIYILSEDGLSTNQTCNFTAREGVGQELTIYCRNEVRGIVVEITDSFRTQSAFTLCEVDVFTDEAVPCGEPDLPYNGYGIKSMSPQNLRTYTFVCKEGFYLEGSKTAYCATDGNWYPHTPRCIEIPAHPTTNQPKPNDFLHSNGIYVFPAAVTVIIGAIIALTVLRKKWKQREGKKSAELEKEEPIYSTIDYNNLPVSTSGGIHPSSNSIENIHIYSEINDCIPPDELKEPRYVDPKVLRPSSAGNSSSVPLSNKSSFDVGNQSEMHITENYVYE